MSDECDDYETRVVLGFLRLHLEDAAWGADCAMAIDYTEDHGHEMAAQVGRAYEVIRARFGHKCRSVGWRGDLRDRLVGIIFGWHVYRDRDVLSFVTCHLGAALMGVILDAPMDEMLLFGNKIEVVQFACRNVLLEHVTQVSARFGLVKRVVGILRKGKR